jgi:hypothetical protein
MTLVSLRPILTLGAGIVIGLLIAWGVFGRNSIRSPNTPVMSATTPNQSVLQAGASSTPASIQQTLTLEAKPSASASSSSSPAPQVNGPPLGVTQDALNYNKELYNKYPGLKPPLVNTDGRDLGPEARQQMQAPPTMLPTPTPGPGVSVSPFPLALPNKPAIQSISPLPSQQDD